MAFDTIKAAELSREAQEICNQILKFKQNCEELWKNNSEAIGDAAESYACIKYAIEAVSEATKEPNKYQQYLQYTGMVEKMQEEMTKSFTTPSKFRCTLASRTTVSMVDKEAGMDWLRENGYETLIQPTVNASSLGAMAKELMETENKQLPDNLFNTNVGVYVSLTKVK